MCNSKHDLLMYKRTNLINNKLYNTLLAKVVEKYSYTPNKSYKYMFAYGP